MTATIHQPASALSAMSQRRRSRAHSVATATFSTSAIYLAASAAGVSFNLTDPGKSQPMHLTLPVIAGFTLFFALAGWAALAALERHNRRAQTIWSVLAGAVLLLSFAPIGIEHASPATKTVLALIHCTVAAALFPMLRYSPAHRRA
jgi:uncharacterized protein DUF6069